jgi:uncharacterized protein DUF6894
MRKFYFNFRQGQSFCPDEDGCDFASTDEAYLGAFVAAQELWRELLIRREDPRECAFEVTDLRGSALFTLPFSEILDVCRPTSPSNPVVGAMAAAVAVAVALDSGVSAHRVVKDVSVVVTETRSALRETLKMLKQVSAVAEVDPFRTVSEDGTGNSA